MVFKNELYEVTFERSNISSPNSFPQYLTINTSLRLDLESALDTRIGLISNAYRMEGYQK